MTLQQLAHLRLSLAPGLFIQDPVAAVDARTSQDDLRIAYAVARGRALNTIDPTTGREAS